VRVVNDAGELLWPLDSAGGFPVSVRIKPERADDGGNAAASDHTQQAVRQRLHAALADRVAKLFYNHEAGTGGRGLEEKVQLMRARTTSPGVLRTPANRVF
jgi:hypothetical protein